jgi:hypothetical protein
LQFTPRPTTLQLLQHSEREIRSITYGFWSQHQVFLNLSLCAEMGNHDDKRDRQLVIWGKV